MEQFLRHSRQRILYAFLFVSLAAVVGVWPLDALGSTLAWVTFYPAVIAAALLGGLATGLLAATLACLVVAFLWPFLVSQPFVTKPSDLIGMAIFVITCALISGLSEVMHRANARAREAQEKAESAIRGLTESSQRIAQNERFIKSITDAMPGMIAYWDKDLYCRFANHAYLIWFGQAPEAVIGRKIQELMGQRLFAMNEPYIKGALAGVTQNFERALKKADGSIGYTWAQYIPDIHADGTVVGFYVLVSDVTRLVQSEANVRSLMDNLPYLAWRKDTQGRYLAINEVLASYLGLKDPQHVTGKSDFDLHPRELAEKYRADDEEVMAQRQQKHVEESAFDGNKIHWVETYKTAVISDDGEVLGTVGIAQDITERKILEAELRIAARAFESRDAMIITDADGVILKVNQSFTKLTGYTAVELIGQTPRVLKSGRHSEEFYRQMWDSIHLNGGWEGEIWDRRKSGEEYMKWLTISEVKDTSGKVTHYIGTQHDISSLKKAEADLRELNQALMEKKDQLRELAVQNEAVRERERKHMAREVHDELGQVLTALRMETSFIAMRFGNLDQDLNAKVLGMRALVDNAILGVRNVASSLRPMALDMGLYSALDWLCQDFEKRTGVACVLDAQDQNVALDEARCIVVFRIVQESLTNISRYASASQVFVTLGLNEHEIGVEIQDNGNGFDPQAIRKTKSFGLLGMSERALALGGRLDVMSSPGQGTTLGLSIPIERRLDGTSR